ncbi:MAG TPA: Holliday junction resolvase RuvX [Dehalococcoidia bacterium]|nr:Holliday junction resolvase RuvX [Dehalococcoidia bacterium]
MRSLGLDIGDRRIGVALSDPEGILASPLAVINRRNESLDIEAITEIIRQHQVGQVVVGLPLSMDGSLGQQAEKVKDFTRKLGEHTQVPLEYRDERLTTVMAEHLKRAAGGKKKGEKTRYDAQAAAIILQGYLDEKHKPELT